MLDTTSWMQVRSCVGPPCTTGEAPGTQFPRSWIDRQWWGSELWNLPGGATALGRWVALPQTSSGTMQSPYLYTINPNQFNGYAGFRGHRQIDYYVSPYAVEATENITTLRLDRHTVESIIDSFGGNHWNELAPWLPMLHNQVFGVPQTEADVVARLMMLRGKNIPERLFYLDTNNPPIVAQSWPDTRTLCKRIDAPYIYNIQVLKGTCPPTSEVWHTQQLEYTLRHQGQPRTLDVKTSNGVSEVVVEFRGLAEHETANQSFQVYLETEASVDPTTAFIAVYNFTNSQWVTQTPCGSSQIYTYPSPSNSCRHKFFVRQDGSRDWVDGSGRGFIKIVNVFRDEQTVKHDLLQILQVPSGSCGFFGGESSLAGEQNFDGESDEADLDLFISRFANEHPGADHNMDGIVEMADINYAGFAAPGGSMINPAASPLRVEEFPTGGGTFQYDGEGFVIINNVLPGGPLSLPMTVTGVAIEIETIDPTSGLPGATVPGATFFSNNTDRGSATLLPADSVNPCAPGFSAPDYGRDTNNDGIFTGNATANNTTERRFIIAADGVPPNPNLTYAYAFAIRGDIVVAGTPACEAFTLGADNVWASDTEPLTANGVKWYCLTLPAPANDANYKYIDTSTPPAPAPTSPSPSSAPRAS